MIRRKIQRPRGNIKIELVRKLNHMLVGILTVLLVHGGILTVGVLGLITVLFAAVVLYNISYERELLMRVLSINRPDAKVPGLDLLSYLVGMWLSLVLFPTDIAFAAIMILAFGDPLAHLVGRSFGGTKTAIPRESHWYGFAAGTIGGTLAAWLPGYAGLLPALLASALAMFVEAGELRIADHHIDDNLTIPLVAGLVLWVIQLAA